MDADDLTPVWKALSDPTRRGLLDLLRQKPRTTGELCGAFENLSRFAVMKHLGILEEAGLVVVRKQGRQRWNYLNAVPLRRIYERWVSEYESSWAGSLLRLKRETEGSEPSERGRKVMLETKNEFQIEQELLINAEPEAVFDALTAKVGEWWTHTFSDSPRAVRLEPQVGGRFYEEFGDGGGALYATITQIWPGKGLAFTGPMGMLGPVVNFIRFDLEPHEGSTVVKLSHHAIGKVDDEIRQNYDSGWKAILSKGLKTYLED